MNKESSTMASDTPSPASGAPSKPMAPMWIFKLANPLVKAILHSPLHGLLSKQLMLLTYRGRTSGKEYTIPIGYFPWSRGEAGGVTEVIAFTSARWFVNVRDGQLVTLVVKRRPVTAVATVIEERQALLATLAEFVKRLGPATAHRLPVGLPADRPPTQAELEAIPSGVAMVVFTLNSTESQGSIARTSRQQER